MLIVPVDASLAFEFEICIDCSLFDVPQPSMLKVSIAQANAAKRVLRFTAEYLQKEIFRIVAASVTWHKVTKVMAPHGGELLSRRVCGMARFGTGKHIGASKRKH